MSIFRRLQVTLIVATGIIALAIFFWKPTALVYGIQRAGLYAAVALPMALVLGIVHIVNLAHGEMMMVAAYLSYFTARTFGVDPFVAIIPTTIIMFVLGIILYRITIRKTVDGPELNQLILTFGVAMVLGQTVNLIATSQPRKLSLDYVSASATVGGVSFGVYDFVFVALALLSLLGLYLFLKRTRLGQAATAVGQNPRGARIVGIDVQRTYTIVFAISAALLGVVGTFFMTKFSIFPMVGGAYTMRSFSLVAMASIGNLPMIVVSALILGIAEAAIQGIPDAGGWAPLVFFALIIFAILLRSFKGGNS
jgi:branched-chain amino acid transport system permease protein